MTDDNTISSKSRPTEHPFTAIETIPLAELTARHKKCRTLLDQVAPQAGGMLIFSRVNLYYLTGTLANGVLWLPQQGEPVLFVRHGLERCRLESTLKHVLPYRSFSDIGPALNDTGNPLTQVVAVESGGLTWQLGTLLEKKFSETTFIPADKVLTLARSVKSEWELNKLRLAGKRHYDSLFTMLPSLIRPGMNEREISHIAWNVFFQRGHSGLMRMNAYGEEVFLGHVSAGDSGNYPSHFNGPLGLRGEHPATPVMGYSGQIWQQGMPLSVDIGFCLEGYHTDKTQVYWAGPSSSIPDAVQRAQDACISIQNNAAEKLKDGAIPSQIYVDALSEAEKAGFSEGFMGLGTRKVRFLGHGIGLGVDEYPVLAKGFDHPFEKGMVIALEPKISIDGIGMVGVENTYEITDKGAHCLTGDNFAMVCVE